MDLAMFGRVFKGIKRFLYFGVLYWGVDALNDALTEIKKEGTQFMGTVRNARVNQGGPKCAGIVGLVQACTERSTDGWN